MLHCLRGLGRTALAAVLALSMVLAGGISAHAATLNIDYAEAPEFEKNKQIRIFFDLLDQEFKVIKDLQPPDIKGISIDGEAVEGDIEIQTYAEAKEWIGLAILMAAHNSYTQTFDALPEDEEGEGGEEGEEGGGEQAATPSTFDRAKQGIANLIRKLDGNDRVAVFRYDERGLRQVASWTGNVNAAAKKVEKQEKCPADECKDMTAPRLFDALKEVVNKVKDKADKDDGFPRRKLVLVMTDGKDPTMNNRKRREQKTAPITELAADTGVKIYAIGYTEEETEPLVAVGELASATKGVYREIPQDTKKEDIPSMIEDVGEEIKKQYVLTFLPNTEVFRGAEKPVKIRIEASKDGEDAGGEIENIKVNLIPTDIWPIIMWVLIGLGSLLGIFLLIKMIKAIAAARANRPVEVVEEYDDGPVGPYKGKLTVLEGTYVGAEFYLTDDVTTIGAMDGNNIVLEAPGVSKRHAGIKIEDMRFELADFGSTNGTHVNGNKITKQFLRDQDIIRIGDCKMKFSLK